MTAEQRIVRFRGDVQGVGFRYTTVRTAERYDVTGYVRNLPGGQVECVAEGSPAEIDAFLDDLAERMARHIRDRTEQTAPAGGSFHGFDVRY